MEDKNLKKDQNKSKNAETPIKKIRSEGYLRAAFKRLLRHKLALIGMVILAIFVVLALFGHLLTPHTIQTQNLRNRFSPPTWNRIGVTGIALTPNLMITGVENGELYAQDATFGLPRWFIRAEAATQSPPIVSGDMLFLGISAGQVIGYTLDRGIEEWRLDLNQEPDFMLSTSTGVLALKDKNKVYSIDFAGEIIWQTDLAENIVAKTFGKIDEPLLVTTEGQILAITSSGETEIIASFNHEVSIVYFDQDKIFAFGAETVSSFSYSENTQTAHGQFDADQAPLAMVRFDDKLIIAFDDGNTIAYNYLEESTSWRTTFPSPLVSLDRDDRSVKATALNGRLQTLNPLTGGITSSRMVEGYSEVHYLGTDELGRDIFTRLVAGGRVSLSLGVIVSLLGISIGSFVGAISGYFGGVVDNLIMRFVDFMLSMPSLPLLMIFSYILGSGFSTMVIVLVALGWIGICRVVRGQTLSLKEADYVLAARALGAKTPKIIFQHILPNTMAPIIVAATLAVGNAILAESQLSYLGLGINPPTPSWGNMLMQARTYLDRAPWLAFWPGFCIFMTLLAINFIGDGLRDALDPKLKGRS